MEQKKKSAFTPLETPVVLEKSFLTGFTLVELLIVIALIGILAGITITRYGPVLESGRRAEAYAVLSEIVTAEKRYYLDSDPPSYTATITNLDSFPSTLPNPLILSSDNFNFSVTVAATLNQSCAQAAPTAAGGVVTYSMCVHSGRRGSTACPPGGTACP